jgi:hypothetical protein
VPNYITRAVLKNRLSFRAVPLPEIDDDLDVALETASGMVADRVDTTAFDVSTPPASVKQVTLMLAMDLWTWDILHGVDANGRPMSGDLWTPAMTQILGSLMLDETPETGTGLLPTAGVMTKTAPIASPAGWPDANAERYGGTPNPDLTWWGGNE